MQRCSCAEIRKFSTGRAPAAAHSRNEVPARTTETLIRYNTYAEYNLIWDWPNVKQIRYLLKTLYVIP